MDKWGGESKVGPLQKLSNLIKNPFLDTFFHRQYIHALRFSPFFNGFRYSASEKFGQPY